ncbi:stAR-related lipid transfer protein 9 [Mixophyes fleayi]|uniref:stAR-related lipid transfer protein 9 n=1 Tax=Mixophyes fleayi TaxID=3061075 RepID=UPI003F4E393F
MANVRVALRVRPLSKRENTEDARIALTVDEKIVRIRNLKLDYKSDGCGDTRERLLEFGFDYCYWSVDPEDPKHASQEVVFQDLGTTVLSEAIKGYNVCLFAYGQTGSGKTYTMMGTPTSIGLTPRICEGLFSYNDDSPGTPSSCRIEVSFLEIYNERVRDLLHHSDQKKPYTLRVREHPEKGPYVQGLSQHVVTDYEQVMALLEEGMENRITAATHVHDASSRSHAIFTIQYTQAMLEDNLPSEVTSKINLVDLAGSERASPNYCKDRLTEGSNINRSLVTLGIVISALAQNSQMTSSCQSINSMVSDGDSGIPGSPSGSCGSGSKRQPFVPYRDSILTWLLKDSLGGNSKTIMIATVSPASSSYNETMSTLRYASNAKNIINKPRVNEDANVKLIRELREEINRLKAMLRNFEMSMQRTISPSFGEERDGNLTELVLQNELKIEQLTKDWTDKWTDKAAAAEQYNVDINKGKTRVTIDSSLPHLIAMDDDILSTGVVIYHLREGTTDIGRGDHDIVLQGECIEQDHCVITNNCGVVELRSVPGALCTVNGQEVKEVCRLSQGDVVVLGKFHRFRFNHPAEAAVLRQMRSDSQASFVSDCSLDWLDLSADFSSSSNGNSLTLNTRNTEPLSEEYQQRLKDLQASYQLQADEQQQYVEDLKRQIQAAQVKGETELENEQSLINQQIQENQQWLEKEKQRLTAVCEQRRETASQTEPKTYVEAEVQNSVQTDAWPSPEEHDRRKLVQLELLRKCSLRRAERNIRRKRVRFQLERIAKKQKLLEAKKTLQQLQAACLLSDDTVKPAPLHVPKVKEPLVCPTALHRSRSSPSGFSYYRRCSLPWTLQTPLTYSALLKRKCKSELVHNSKIRKDCRPVRSVSIDCLLKTSCNYGNYGQCDSDPSIIGTAGSQVAEKQSFDSHTKQINTGVTLLPSEPQMSKTRQKMDKAGGRSKGSSSNSTAEPPKKRTVRATVNTGTKDTKLKTLKSPSPMTVGDSKKSTVRERSRLPLKIEGGKSPTQKSTQRSLGQGKASSGESLVTVKTATRNTASSMPSAQKKMAGGTSKISSSVDNICKLNNGRVDRHTSDRRWMSTERLNMGLQKMNFQTLENWKEDDNSELSDSESFYSVDSLSSAYASVLTEQLKQEEVGRQRNTPGHKDSDSEDSQLSEDSLVERDNRKERPNKRRFNKYKTIVTSSSPSKSLMGDQKSYPLLTTGSVTTGFSKSFSLDSLADTEEVPEGDSSEELPAEIFWKLQSPRCLVLNGEDQKVLDVATAGENTNLDRSGSFYLKMNDWSVSDYSDVSLAEEIKICPETLSNVCGGKSQQIHDNSFTLHNCSPKPTGNTLHGNITPLVISLNCAPKYDSPFREDEMKELITKDNVVKIEPQTFPDILKALNTQATQDTKLCEKQIQLCNVEESESKTSDNRVIPNHIPEQTATSPVSEKLEDIDIFSSTAPNPSIKDKPLDNTSSTVKTCSENQISNEEQERRDMAIDNGIVASDLESNCDGKSNSISSLESSLDLRKCEKTTSASEKNTSVELQIACGKDVSCRMESQETKEKTESENIISTQLNVTYTNKPTSSISLRNANEVYHQLCSSEMLSDICLREPKENCGASVVLSLTKENENIHYHSVTTAKNFDQNKNVTIAMSACNQLQNLKNQNQSLTFPCPQFITSEHLVPEALDSEPISPKLIGMTSPLKADDQKINCDFKSTKLLSQIQVATVELDINANKDCKAEAEPCPVLDTNGVFKHDNGAGSIERHTSGKIAGAENTDNAVSVINKQSSTVEDKCLVVFTDQSEDVDVVSPIEYNSVTQQKGKLPITSFPASHHSNVTDTLSVSRRYDCESDQSNEDSDTQVQSCPSYHSPFQTSQETTMDGIYSSSVPILTDNYTRNLEQTLTSSHSVIDHTVSASYNNLTFKQNDEDQQFSTTNGNILWNPVKPDHKPEVANESFELVATNTSHIPEDVAADTVKICLNPNFRTQPEVNDRTRFIPYIKSLDHKKSSTVGSSEDTIDHLSSVSDIVCVTPCNVSSKVAKEKTTLPDNRVQINSDQRSESYSPGTTCFIHKAKGLPHIRNTNKTFLSPEYANDENKYNTENLPKTHSDETSVSHGARQTDRTQSALSTHISELDQHCNSSTINVAAARDPLLCSSSHCEDANGQIHTNKIPQLLKELMEENIVSKTEDPSQINEEIPIKNKMFENTNDNQDGSEIKSEKDISNIKDSASSLTNSNHQKHFSGPYTDGNKEQVSSADVSYPDVNSNQQEMYDSADHHVTEDISGTCLPIPYYEAIMQNKLFCQSKSENVYLSTHSEYQESSETIFLPKQTGLNKFQEYDAHADGDCKENDTMQCSRILKCKTGRLFFNGQNEQSELGILYGTGDCIAGNQSVVTDSSMSSATNVVIPELQDVSQQVKYSATELDGAICSESVTGKCNYFQSRHEEAGEQHNCGNNKAQDILLAQQKQNQQYINRKEKCESASAMNKVENITDTTSIVYSPKPDLCRSEVDYSVLKNTNNLPNATSIDTSQCCVSGELQEAVIDPLKNCQFQPTEDKGILRNICAGTESNEVLFAGRAYCGANLVAEMSTDYEPSCRRPSQDDLSVDEVHLEHNMGATSEVSDFIINKNKCELELLTDKNPPPFTNVFDTSTVSSTVTYGIQQNDQSVAAGDIEDKNLRTIVPCGECCSDLDKSPEQDTETSRYLVSRNFSGLEDISVNTPSMRKECASDSPVGIHKQAADDIPCPAHLKGKRSSSLMCTKAHCTILPSLFTPMATTELHLTESSTNKSPANPGAETLPHKLNYGRRSLCNEHYSKMESKTYAPHTVTEFNIKKHDCLCDSNQASNPNVNPQHNAKIKDNFEVEGRACLPNRAPTNILSSLFSESSPQANKLAVELVENAEGLHFSSSDINPFVHTWQQEKTLKPGWRNSACNSASDVSCTKFRAEVDKLMRCSSVDEGLNAHNSPFHSHLSSYANARTGSSTISSFEGNGSGPYSLDSSQDLLSDDTAAACSGAEFVGPCELQTKFENDSNLDEIMILYTSESETCNETDQRVSCAQEETQIKQKHRKVTKHQRSYTEESSSRQMRRNNVDQRPASWSSVQNMSLHLSQLLQETSELLGNLSQPHSQNVYFDVSKMHKDPAELILKRQVRDSYTQTSVDRGIQTDSQTTIKNKAQNPDTEHNSFVNASGINVFVKVVGTDSLTQIPQNTCLSAEQNGYKAPKTQSLPNLHAFVSSKQSEHGLSPSPKVRASTPFLNDLQDMSSISLPLSLSRKSPVLSSVNKDTEDPSLAVIISSSSSVVHTPRYQTTRRSNTTMVDRASSPILTLSASRKSLNKLVPENPLNSPNLGKTLCPRKRRERGIRNTQINGSQTETDSECFSSYSKSNVKNEFEALRSNSLKESSRKRTATHKVPKFTSEGCILRDEHLTFNNHSSSNSEMSGVGKRPKELNYFTSTQSEKISDKTFATLPPWESPQSLENLSQMLQPMPNKNGQVLPQGPRKELSNNGSFTITSNSSYLKNRNYPYLPSQISGFDLHLQEDGLSVVESDCNTDILLGQEPTFRINHKPQNYTLQDLPLHNKFSNWSGVQCSTPNSVQLLRSMGDLNIRDNCTEIEASQEVLESRCREIERLQRERAEVMSGIHLERNPQPLTVQLAEAKLSYGIGETDALLRVIQTRKTDGQDTVSIKKQLYERHLQVIENLRKEREERLQRFRRSRSLSPQKQLSLSQASLTSLRESDLPSRRREYLQQLRKDMVDNTRIHEPKKRSAQCPSEIDVMLKDYQKAREEAKMEIARARDKLRERAELEKRRLQQSSLPKEDTKMKTLVSTSTLFTSSSLSLSSGPTSGYNSGMTATLGRCSKLGSQETNTLPRSVDPQLRSGRGRPAVRNCHLSAPSQVAAVPGSPKVLHTPAEETSPDKAGPYSLLHVSLLQSPPVSYQGLVTKIQASAMAEVMAACSCDINNLYNRQAAAGWIYQTTAKDILVYSKAFSSPTQHGFIGAGVIKRPLQDVWCMVKDINTRQLYDPSILTGSVHQRVSSSIQLVHVMTDMSLCYLKQPRDFCCITVESKEDTCCSLSFQSLYNESMPRPTKDTVRGELLPSAWILQADTISGETVTRVIYMVQVDLGAPAIPSRLLSVVSKRQPLVIASLASFLSR